MNFHHRTKNVSNVFHNNSRPKRNESDEKKQSGFVFSNGDGKDEEGSSCCTCQERTELKIDDDSSAVSTRSIRQKRSHANTLQTQSKEDIKRLKLPIEM